MRRFPPIPRPRGRGHFTARRLAWVVDWAFRRGRCLHRPIAGTSVDLPQGPTTSAARTPVHRKKDGFPRRPVGPPRNDKGLGLSLRGAKRRGNPHPPSQRRPCGKGDVCERRQWRKKRAKRSGSGQNSVGVCEQRILGTVTDVQIPFWNLIDGGHALGTTGAVTASP